MNVLESPNQSKINTYQTHLQELSSIYLWGWVALIILAFEEELFCLNK